MQKPEHPLRILLTNDDGISAPGLAVLEEIARELSDDVWVVAPEHDQSGTGQSLTLTNPLRASPQGKQRWAVSGTPADCVSMALSHFMKDAKPSLLLSGINSGANVGEEVNLSGTLGAVFTGLMFDIPSIGLSQAFITRKNINWAAARSIAPKVLRYFLKQGWPQDTCLSINIPDRPAETIKGFSWAQQSRRNITAIQANEREDQREGMYYWLKVIRETPQDGTSKDCSILEHGEVTVTALKLDRSVATSESFVPFSSS